MWALSTRFYLVVVVFCSRLWNCRISVLDSETTWAWPGDRVKTTLLPSTANTRRVRQKAKVFAAVWGRCTLYSVQDVLECCLHYTHHISARSILKKSFGRTSIVGGWWFGLVRTRRSSIFLKHLSRQVYIRIFIHFFKSRCC